MIQSGATVRDVDAQPPLYVQAPLAAALKVLGRGPWKYARPYRALQDYRVRDAVTSLRPDAVIEIADLVVPTCVPTYSYQDSSFAVALDHYETFGRDMVSTCPTTREQLRRLADEQHRKLSRLDGVLAMGQWFGDYLVDRGILPADRVHVVGAGISPQFRDLPTRVPRSREQRRRLLFVGGEFRRKGGDWVLDAVERLNRQGDRRLTVTVVGPAAWPMPQPPPDWVDFRGALARDRVRDLFQEHDLFVMPSRFEAYGIAFREARAAGLPCVGRDAFAMPELIEPGVGGAVWSTDDVDDLAGLILACLDDDALHERCARAMSRIADESSWTCVAGNILRRMAVA
ncbi:MAG: glycosyltransferase family 4 protein [Panacagrimonas sp.]